MAFTGFVLTNQGLALQAKVEAGTTLNFVEIKLGSGTLGTGQTLETLTDLISPQQILSINSCSVVEGNATIAATVSNTGLEAGYMVNEIGVYATDPTAGTILYAVANAGGQCDYLPAGGGAIVVEEVLNVVMAVGNSSTVTANLVSGIYATLAELAASTTGRLLNVQVFTASGTYTPITGMNTAVIEVQGAGGGGGGCAATGAATVAIGAPGSAGAYAKGKYNAATIGASQTITIGAAGAAGVGGSNGGNGGTSSFGSLISAPGGLGGNSYGPSSAPMAYVAPNGSSAPAGGNIYEVAGATTIGSFIMTNASSGVGLPGIGAPSVMGGAGGYGGGGSGTVNGTSKSAINGGIAGAGLVIVYEYA